MVTDKWDDGGKKWWYTYASAMRDGEGIVCEYDVEGRCTRIHYLDGGITRRNYDRNGRPVCLIRSNEYRELGRIRQAHGEWYAYDLWGRLLGAIRPDGALQARYT